MRCSVFLAARVAPGSACPTLAYAIASVWELASIYSALIQHNNEVTVKEKKISTLIKAAGVKFEPFWPGWFAKALANINIGSFICKIVFVGPVPAEGPALSITAAPANENQVEAKKEESDLSSLTMA